MKARIIGHLAGSIPVSAVWLVAVNLPQGTPSSFLQAAAILPQMVAVTSLLIQHAADAYNQQTVQEPTPPPPVPVQTRPRQKELTYR